MAHHELKAAPLTVGHAEKIEAFRREIANIDGKLIWLALSNWVKRYPNEPDLHNALAHAAMARALEWAAFPPGLQRV